MTLQEAIEQLRALRQGQGANVLDLEAIRVLLAALDTLRRSAGHG